MLKEHFIKPQELRLAAFAAKNEVNTFLIADKRCAALRHNKTIQSFY